MFQALEEAHDNLDSPIGSSSSAPATSGYFLPEEAFRQLEVARDTAGFIHDLAAEVERSQVPVSPGKLVSLLELIITNLDLAIDQGSYDQRPSGGSASAS